MKLNQILVSAVAFVIAGCSGLPTQEREIELGSTLRSDLLEAVYYDSPVSNYGSDKKLATLYPITSKGVVWAQDGGPEHLLDAESRRYPLIREEAGRVYAMYWQKVNEKGDKALFFSRSADGGKSFEPAQHISFGGVLARYDLASDGQENLIAVYLDERFGDNYQIFLNRSHDGGKSWLKQDVRMDTLGRNLGGFNVAGSMEPRVVFHKGSFVATWKDYGLYADGKRSIRLLSVVSRDQGRTWQGPYQIHAGDSIVSDETTWTDGDTIYYLGAIGEGVVGFRSRDGVTWEKVGPLPGSYTAASQLTAKSLDGRVHVAFTARQQDGSLVSDIYYGTWIPGQGWAGEARSITSKNERVSRALVPSLAVSKGVVAVAWQDSRTVRPNTILAFSSDHGKTWSQPKVVEALGRYNSKAPQLIASDDGFTLLYQRFHEGQKVGSYQRVELPVDAGKNLPTLVNLDDGEKERRVARLRERVEGAWNARMKGKREDLYSFYDPVFRSRVSLDEFKSSEKIKVNFFDFKVLDTNVNEQIGDVAVERTLEIPKTVVGQTEVKVDKRTEVGTERWVWMDGDWYQIFTIRQTSMLQF